MNNFEDPRKKENIFGLVVVSMFAGERTRPAHGGFLTMKTVDLYPSARRLITNG